MTLNSSIFDQLRIKASRTPKTIVYPEGNDKRVIEAVKGMVERKMIKPVLLGRKAEIEELCGKYGIEIAVLDIIDPVEESEKEEYCAKLREIFRKKDISNDKARELAEDHLVFGCLLVRMEKADGFVGGAVRTTADTVRAAFRVIGLESKFPTLSSCFLMELPESARFNSDGRFVYADCGVVINPSAKQLADIAIASAKSFADFTDSKPRVAFLSFSTKGSAKAGSVEKIKQAVEMVRLKKPELAVDGEMQFDAAIDADVAGRKIKGGSPVAGKANVFIFPDLNSGNIAYKITNRLAKARACGPILQGLAGAANDVSRGCSVDDIIDVTAVTVLQAEALKVQGQLAEVKVEN